MRQRLRFPAQAEFGKVIPKARIFAHAEPGSRVKAQFAREVEQLTWTHKLAPHTLNLPAHPDVQEIQVIHISLKSDQLSEELLRVLDRAIPSPLLYAVQAGELLRYVATYKRPHRVESEKWILGDYWWTDWMPADTEARPLPLALDLQGLYHALLRLLMPLPARPQEDMDAHITRAARVRALTREADALRAKLLHEKQFNRKVEINQRLRSLQEEIESLG
jgi:Domain of unknown function (DUF4391)